MLTTKIKDIADAIREKTESNELFQLDDMPDAIRSISGGDGKYNGSYDVQGLQELGYSTEQIEDLNSIVDFDEELNDNFILSQDEIDIKNNPFVAIEDTNKKQYIRFLPNLDMTGISNTQYINSRFKEMRALIYVPTIDLTNQISLYRTFYQSWNLRKVGNMDTSKISAFSGIFSNCYRLEEIPEFDYSSGTSCDGMFSSCYTLKKAPSLYFPKATSVDSLFSGCFGIVEVGDIDCPQSGSMSTMFSNCFLLKKIGEINGTKTRNLNSAFNYCYSLEDFEGIKDIGKDFSTTSSENYSNYKINLSYSIKLTHASLMNVINKLYDIKTKGCRPQMLQLGEANLAKLTEAEKQIAIDKGWNLS